MKGFGPGQDRSLCFFTRITEDIYCINKYLLYHYVIPFDMNDGTVIRKPVHNLATYIQSCKKTLFSHTAQYCKKNDACALSEIV